MVFLMNSQVVMYVGSKEKRVFRCYWTRVTFKGRGLREEKFEEFAHRTHNIAVGEH